MARISKFILTGALAAMVAARPLHVPRAPAPAEVTETAWTTINVPVTLWVDENGTPLSTVAQGGNFAAVATAPANSPAAVVTSSSTTTVTTESPQAPVQTPSSPPTTPAYVPTTTAAAQPQVVASSPAAASPAPASGGDTAIAASSSNNCEGMGTACSGDITHYDGGLGACGWTVDTKSEMAIALPYLFMGEKSNDNEYCGRSLTVRNPTTGQTQTARVVDKCMGCTGRSIDLTDALFGAIGNGCDGRCAGFEWWFN